jgi:hypothetical protein
MIPLGSNIEQKFVLPLGSAGTVLEWLRFACIPHPLYSKSAISSLYFDTPLFDLYLEKRESDYLKTKWRLRWYDLPIENSLETTVPCFLEVKEKIGALRRKSRTQISLPVSMLKAGIFANPIVRDLPFSHGNLANHPSAPLVPLAVIRYMRHRFIDPATGSGVALDVDITCDHVNPQYLAVVPPVRLDEAVLETKGESRHFPNSLVPIANYLRRDAYSKYARCLEALHQPFGRRC